MLRFLVCVQGTYKFHFAIPENKKEHNQNNISESEKIM